LRTLPDMYDRQVDDGWLPLLEQDVMLTLPDFRVVQLVPASAEAHMPITMIVDRTMIFMEYSPFVHTGPSGR
jgi:hypothetical protein